MKCCRDSGEWNGVDAKEEEEGEEEEEEDTPLTPIPEALHGDPPPDGELGIAAADSC